MNKLLWIKGSVLSQDFVLTDEGILVIKVVPTAVLLLSPILIGLGLWLRLGSVNFGLLILDSVLSTPLWAGFAILRRRRLSSRSLDNLSQKKGITRIEWKDIAAVQLRDGRFSIWARGKKYTAQVGRSDALFAIRLIRSHANASERVLKSRWGVFACSMLLIALVFILTFAQSMFPSLASAFFVLMLVSTLASIGSLGYVIWKPRVVRLL